MKTFEQLAESAYKAYNKKMSEIWGPNPAETTPYGDLPVDTQACWRAAVSQVAAEIAAIH